jgi:hypothetical protein
MNRTIAYTLTLLFVLVNGVRAGFVFDSGNMHASASATSGAVSTSSSPPDKVMSGLGGSHSASALATGPNGTATSFAGIFSSSDASTISLGGNTTITRSQALGFNGASQASLTLSIIVTQSVTFPTHFTFSGNAGGAFVTITDSGSNVIFTQSKGNPNDPVPPDSTVSFVPGTYSVSSGVSGFPVAFTGGSTAFTWQTIPEPASPALLGCAAAASMIVRRRRREQ